MNTYTFQGKEYRLNDHVCTHGYIHPMPDDDRHGRLVQVRKGAGQFGTDLYLIRLKDGRLHTFENVILTHAHDERFNEAFYRSNGMHAPVCEEFEPIDEEGDEYTIRGEFPAIGFVVANPGHGSSVQSFAMTITNQPRSNREG